MGIATSEVLFPLQKSKVKTKESESESGSEASDAESSSESESGSSSESEDGADTQKQEWAATNGLQASDIFLILQLLQEITIYFRNRSSGQSVANTSSCQPTTGALGLQLKWFCCRSS